MSDDLPTGERLGRIERGVQRRIDRRRQVAQRIAGASVAVVLVVGGFALVRPVLTFGGSASSSGGAGGSARDTSAGDSTASGAAAPATAVRCHDGSRTTTVRVGGGDLAAAATAACIAEVRRAATAAAPADGGPSPLPSPSATVCESPSGVLHVYLRDPATCATHGLVPFRR